MTNYLNEIYLDIFTNENIINDIWNSRNSDVDIIPIKSSFPVRNKFCNGERSIEVWTSSEFGMFSTQLCLVNKDFFVFPRKGVPYSILDNMKEQGYSLKYYSDEHDVTSAAFSITSLMLALKKEDAEFECNNHKMELVVTTDGSISCFKQSPKLNQGLAFALPSTQMQITQLDDEVVSIYKFIDGKVSVYSTPISEKYYLFLKQKRRLEVFTLE